MAEYKVTINATPSKAKTISVSPKNVQNTITATPDSSLYFSNLSKKWAIEMNGMVNGEDYSSKYYANVSAENAQISQTNAQACEDTRVLLQGEYNEYSENLLETKTNAVDEINTLTDNSISELQTKSDDLQSTADNVVATGKNELQKELSGLRTSASSIVSTSKTDIQNTATSAKNTAISAIQTQQTTSVNAVKTEGTTQVNLAKAQATAAANSATQASNVVKQVEDDLDSKVDIDDMVEVDFVDAGSYIAGRAMPSDKYIDLTLGTSEATYTAPANGWYLLVKKNAATGQYVDVSVNGVIRFHCVEPSINDQSYVCFLPVKKGDVLSIKYNLTGTTSYFRFYYAVGSESEAQ